MFWAKCIISIVWNGMKMGNGNSHCKFLYNYIEKLFILRSCITFPSLQNDLIFQLTLIEAGRQTTKPKAESRKPKEDHPR